MLMPQSDVTQPALEIVHRPAKGRNGAGKANLPPLVFVHGAFCAAWVWEEHYLPFFAAQGYDVYAVSLRGHGKSQGQERLRDTSLDEFCADLNTVAAQVEEKHSQAPVLIGHSMGGMVVQRVVEGFETQALQRGEGASAMVLMSSVPPGGLWGTSLNMMMNDPFLFWQMGALQAFGAGAATLNGLHRAMFTGDTPVELTAAYLTRLQEESLRVQMELSSAPPPVATNGCLLPTFVIGADEDAFVPSWSVKATARHYNAPCHILEHEGHGMMLSTKWEESAEILLTWLNEHFKQDA